MSLATTAVSSDDGSRASFSEWSTACGSTDHRESRHKYSPFDVQHEEMSTEKWTNLASALGIPSADIYQPHAEARRLARKFAKRPNMTDKQSIELFGNLLRSILSNHPILRCTPAAYFNRDAIPDEMAVFDGERVYGEGLRTPKPAFSIGYNLEAFTYHQVELQRGIIANDRGEPRDLSRVSQTVPGVFWPFLIIDIKNKSMTQARNICAGAKATCNNALMMLAGATQDPYQVTADERFLWSLSRSVQAFSLSVRGSEAWLNTQNSSGFHPEAFATIRKYSLSNEQDVEALVSRLNSICIWAENCRLPAIFELIDAFDARVNSFAYAIPSSRAKGLASATVRRHRIITEPKPAPAPPSTKRGLFKYVLTDSLPRWAQQKY